MGQKQKHRVWEILYKLTKYFLYLKHPALSWWVSCDFGFLNAAYVVRFYSNAVCFIVLHHFLMSSLTHFIIGMFFVTCFLTEFLLFINWNNLFILIVIILWKRQEVLITYDWTPDEGFSPLPGLSIPDFGLIGFDLGTYNLTRMTGICVGDLHHFPHFRQITTLLMRYHKYLGPKASLEYLGAVHPILKLGSKWYHSSQAKNVIDQDGKKRQCPSKLCLGKKRCFTNTHNPFCNPLWPC